MATTMIDARVPPAVVDSYAFLALSVHALPTQMPARPARWIRVVPLLGGQTFFGLIAAESTIAGRAAMLFEGCCCRGAPSAPARDGAPVRFYVFARRSGLILAMEGAVAADENTYGEPVSTWSAEPA